MFYRNARRPRCQIERGLTKRARLSILEENRLRNRFVCVPNGSAAGSHLAGVARSLGVPMVLGCRPERVTGSPAVPGGAFLAAIDGSTGDVALLPTIGGWPVRRAGSGTSALSGLHHPASVRPAPGLSGQRS